MSITTNIVVKVMMITADERTPNFQLTRNVV